MLSIDRSSSNSSRDEEFHNQAQRVDKQTVWCIKELIQVSGLMLYGTDQDSDAS